MPNPVQVTDKHREQAENAYDEDGTVAWVVDNGKAIGFLRTYADLLATREALEAAEAQLRNARESSRERELATKIAGESAASLLESNLTMHDREGQRWMSPDSADREDRQVVAEALEYLKLRKAIVTHPQFPYLIRVEFPAPGGQKES